MLAKGLEISLLLPGCFCDSVWTVQSELMPSECNLQIWTISEAGKPQDRLPISLPAASGNAGSPSGFFESCVIQVWSSFRSRTHLSVTQQQQEFSFCTNTYTCHISVVSAIMSPPGPIASCLPATLVNIHLLDCIAEQMLSI